MTAAVDPAARPGGAMPSAEIFRALGALCESPAPGHARIWEALAITSTPDAADYTEVFVLNLYPYGSVYLGGEGMLGGEARDRIAGFWRALRLAAPAEPDHLAALLGLYAALIDREAGEDDAARRASCRQARAALLREHLASWLPPFLGRFETIAPRGYCQWSALLRRALVEDAASLKRAGVGGSSILSAHLRAAPALPDPRRDGSQAFIEGLLAPVRSGMILTRADLARAARDLGLGLRVGERKFVLAALLSQAAGPVLDWLAREAAEHSRRHARAAWFGGEASAFWTARASAASALCGELRRAAVEEAAAPPAGAT